MARHSKKQLRKMTDKVRQILNRPTFSVGTYPGQNRSRKFVDRRREANRNACRGGYQGE